MADTPKKKIIIAYVSAGAGHRSAAEALASACVSQCPAYEVKLVDALSDTNPFFHFLYESGYTFLVRYARCVWGFFFWLAQAGCVRAIANYFNYRNSRRFIRFLLDEKPDIVISTHFLTSHVAARLKRSGMLSPRLVTVTTDYGVHPFWVAEGTDTYIAASESSREELVAMGVAQAKVLVLGIPIHIKFLQEFEKNQLCHKLGLREHTFTVLLATGSFGIGPIEEIVRFMHDKAQLIVVCANNTGLYTRLASKKYPGVCVLGYVDNIEELMLVADVIITKPGGLTVAEILAMELPPIFVSYIPGQESANCAFLARHGIGVITHSPRKICEAIMDYKNEPSKIEQVRLRMRALKIPEAAERICDAVC